jgi:hypothetical protein
MKYIILLFFFPCAFGLKSQPNVKPVTIGIEQDILPYLTGGYFMAFTAGMKHLRGRAVLASVTKPDFVVADGFTNNQVRAYALLGDYFLKDNWSGWWFGGGIVYWDSSIQSEAKLSTAHYQNILLNGSLGYSWKVGEHFYVSPWAGMHLCVGGDTDVVVDGKHFIPPVLNLEASIKVGWLF